MTALSDSSLLPTPTWRLSNSAVAAVMVSPLTSAPLLVMVAKSASLKMKLVLPS